MNKNMELELSARGIPLVSISCITYNHAPYIRQCLDGMLMQKTSFAFEILIHDDASTDGTDTIIKEYADKYPNIIKPIFETENQYQSGKPIGTLVWNLPRAKGKYIALCEGDDYWIDENKLQMQVDFLEKNPEYGMCYTKAYKYIQDKKKIKGSFGSKVNDFSDLLINGNRIPTLSVCSRLNLMRKYSKEIEPSKKHWLMGDYPMWLWIAHNSKLKFFNDYTCIYRVLSESASHSQNIEKKMSFNKSYYEIRQFFSQLYSIPIEERYEERELYQTLCALMLRQRKSKQIRKKVRLAFKQIKYKNMHDIMYYFISYTNILLFLFSLNK